MTHIFIVTEKTLASISNFQLPDIFFESFFVMILIVGIDMRKEELIKLGQIVRNKRIQRNLTQTELSTRSKVDRNYIGMLERGERNPSYLSLLKIASGLEMSINELLTI